MRQNPTIRIEVQGHTDDEGDPGVNLELSRRRAEAVRRYIVAGGIDEARVRWHGYGGTRPIVENKTEAGKARNRRIELRLIDANNKVIVIPQ
jgi:OOP family OmpA-OmpF porin